MIKRHEFTEKIIRKFDVIENFRREFATRNLFVIDSKSKEKLPIAFEIYDAQFFDFNYKLYILVEVFAIIGTERKKIGSMRFNFIPHVDFGHLFFIETIDTTEFQQKNGLSVKYAAIRLLEVACFMNQISNSGYIALDLLTDSIRFFQRVGANPDPSRNDESKEIPYKLSSIADFLKERNL